MGSLNGWPLIVETSTIGLIAHSGSWAAWLGTGNLDQVEEISVIEQCVVVPNSSPVLKYWHWIESWDHLCGYDVAGVLVNGDTAVENYSLCTATNTSGWVQRSLDMSAYAGHAILLSIVVVTDGALGSSLFIDDVFFESDGDESNAIFGDGFECGDSATWN